MDRTEIFQILGIEAAKDEQVIKNAYREKLAVTNPEDDAEGFKRLRTAYEEACRLARQSGEQEGEKEKDASPSGLWVEKAAEIYANIHHRQDLSQWEALFAEDCFLSLEEEENCRLKLLRFLMDHFRLPTEVWKLLDRKLGITVSASSLREHFPADFVRYIANKCERGEDVDFSQFQGPAEGEYDLFLQYYDRCWQAFQAGNPAQAQEYVNNADQLEVYHPVIDICKAELLMRRGNNEEALKLLEELHARYPEDAMICYNTAEKLWQQGEEDPTLKDRAAKLYQSLKAENDSHYMANLRLTRWYYDKGQYQEAKRHAEKVISAGSDPVFMELLAKVNARIEIELEAEYRESGSWEPALELCWCYLQDGKIEKGIRLALKLEKQLPPEKEAEYNGLLAKLYVEEAEYEDSITMTRFWEKSLEKRLAEGEEEEELEKDRDRLRQTHLIRMQCYHNLGFKDSSQFAEALREGESVLENSVKDVGVLLEMAQICVEMQEYERCMELVDKLINEYQVYAAYATSLEACRRQLDAGGVVNAATHCIQYFPVFIKPYEYLAKVYLDLNRPEDFRKVLEDARKNNIKSVILEAYEYQMEHREIMEMSAEAHSNWLSGRLKDFREKYRANVERGRLNLYETGLTVLNELLYRSPDSFMLVERAVFHKAAHHYEEAGEDYEKALSLSPANPYALNGLSQVYKYTGDYEKALVCIKKAILYLGREVPPACLADMADLYSLLGNYEMALAACRQCGEIIKDESPKIWYLDQLAECHENLGQAEEACRVYKRYQDQDKYNSYKKQALAWGRGGQGESARQVLADWWADLVAAGGSGFFRWRARVASNPASGNQKSPLKPAGGDFCRYYNTAGWVELMAGDRKKALLQFEESLKYLNGVAGELYASMLADAVFAFALCGDEKRGAKWGKRLKLWLETERKRAENHYYDREKALLQLELLASWFLEDNTRVQELLDRETGCRICQNCSSPLCRELEGVRILFLLKRGREQEARVRVKGNLELQPADEYMLALRHLVFGDRL